MNTALDMNTALAQNTAFSRAAVLTKTTALRTAGATAGATAGVTRLRLTRRGRLVITALATIPLVATVLFLTLNGGGAAAEGADSATSLSRVSDNATAFDYVTIKSGQSLWQLAESIAPTADPRDVIAEIVSLNQLPSESVQPGQRLALPSEF